MKTGQAGCTSMASRQDARLNCCKLRCRVGIVSDMFLEDSGTVVSKSTASDTNIATRPIRIR